MFMPASTAGEALDPESYTKNVDSGRVGPLMCCGRCNELLMSMMSPTRTGHSIQRPVPRTDSALPRRRSLGRQWPRMPTQTPLSEKPEVVNPRPSRRYRQIDAHVGAARDADLPTAPGQAAAPQAELNQGSEEDRFNSGKFDHGQSPRRLVLTVSCRPDCFANSRFRPGSFDHRKNRRPGIAAAGTAGRVGIRLKRG
jgi:hypothetical protein